MFLSTGSSLSQIMTFGYSTRSHDLNHWWHIVDCVLRNKLQCNFLNEISQFLLKKMHFKMSSAKWWPSCSEPNAWKQQTQHANPIIQISNNAPFCNRNVHAGVYFCYKMVHYGIWDWCIVEFVQQVYFLCKVLVSPIHLIGTLLKLGIHAL